MIAGHVHVATSVAGVVALSTESSSCWLRWGAGKTKNRFSTITSSEASRAALATTERLPVRGVPAIKFAEDRGGPSEGRNAVRARA